MDDGVAFTQELRGEACQLPQIIEAVSSQLVLLIEAVIKLEGCCLTRCVPLALGDGNVLLAMCLAAGVETGAKSVVLSMAQAG